VVNNDDLGEYPLHRCSRLIFNKVIAFTGEEVLAIKGREEA